ncbi:hypothetical protein EVAR_85603_1 [Eumeta japonica]|uniref:Uncharacterized protein n=1 Tax=Eumeta variegata TaxID=151549 RepID=A0A4C1XT51_EUMVA|nr:hypothetical protein EVAR_85603_1 [Eumeta japonica]
MDTLVRWKRLIRLIAKFHVGVIYYTGRLKALLQTDARVKRISDYRNTDVYTFEGQTSIEPSKCRWSPPFMEARICRGVVLRCRPHVRYRPRHTDSHARAHTHTRTHAHTHTHTHRERERERERDTNTETHTHTERESLYEFHFRNASNTYAVWCHGYPSKGRSRDIDPHDGPTVPRDVVMNDYHQPTADGSRPWAPDSSVRYGTTRDRYQKIALLSRRIFFTPSLPFPNSNAECSLINAKSLHAHVKRVARQWWRPLSSDRKVSDSTLTTGDDPWSTLSLSE